MIPVAAVASSAVNQHVLVAVTPFSVHASAVPAGGLELCGEDDRAPGRLHLGLTVNDTECRWKA